MTAARPRDAVIGQPFPLGAQWPTIDPFLFVAHHDDVYPTGNASLGPDASLHGRRIGMDFDGVDGWNMYHGSTVPGFPQHPHRGFETITHVRRGHIDHADSLGATARFGRGDTQWMTAGAGIVHAEMFPLLSDNAENPLELFQIWLNLPAADKMVDPYFTMLWAEQTPHHIVETDRGGRCDVTVVAGALEAGDGIDAPAPPPNSWASRAEADVAIWHVRLTGDASFDLPPTSGAGTRRVLYAFRSASSERSGIRIEEVELASGTGAEIATDRSLHLTAEGEVAECLLLQGRPIGEPVVQHGPFVMNDRAGIMATLDDYGRTGFGGWPWPSDDPVHERDAGRFARHADGRVEHLT